MGVNYFLNLVIIINTSKVAKIKNFCVKFNTNNVVNLSVHRPIIT